MKRILSIIMAGVLVLSVAIVPTFAETIDNRYLYKDKFLEYVDAEYSDVYIGDPTYWELFHHYDSNGDIDWAFVYARFGMEEEMEFYSVICDVYVAYGSRCMPFVIPYGIYDVKGDCFRPLLGIDLEKYEGLEEYVNENIGTPIGDADSDGKLTIIDATFIQQALVGLREFSNKDHVGFGDMDNVGYGEPPIKYISDYDRDGERSVMDATAIQMKLAEIEDTTPTE